MGKPAPEFTLDDLKRGALLQSKTDSGDQPVVMEVLPEDQFKVVCEDGSTLKTFTLQQIAMDYDVVGLLDEIDMEDIYVER